MGLYDNLVQREAGQPRGPAVAGGSPQVSQPASAVNPPAAAQGPVGRPSSPAPPFPGGPGMALPKSPEARPAAAPAGPPGGFARRPPQAPSQPGPGMQPRASEPVTFNAPGAPQPGGFGGQPSANPFVMRLDRVPSPAEMSQLPPGTTVETPYGTMDERGELQLSPEGRVNYQQAVAARLKSYGPSPFAADPSAPRPEVKLGRRAYNPFTGSWTR